MLNFFTKNLLRWIVLLPASLISGFLAKFLIHIFLYSSFVNGRIISGLNVEPFEYYFLPIIVWFVYILIGYKIAPKYKLKTCIILASLYVIVSLSLIIFIKNVSYDFDKIGGVIGIIIGLFIVWSKSRNIEKN